jgi:putative cardiolipin synthase
MNEHWRWSCQQLLLRLLGITVMMLISGCAAVRLDVPRIPSHAIDGPQETDLGRSFATQLAPTPGQSGLHLLVSGKEAFAVRAALAESAQRTLDLQYYIVTQDATSTLLLYRALRAAQRGVRVRLLIDDINTGLGDSDLAVLAQHPNVEVRLFNPFAIRGQSSLTRALELLGNSERLNRRMHNKLWIADNAVAVMGGRNLADAYFDAASESDFGDLDVLVAGPVVPEISRSFDLYWNSEWAVPIEAMLRTPMAADDVARSLAEMAIRAERFRQSDYARTLRETHLGPLVRSGQLPLISAEASALYDVPGDLHAEVTEKQGAIFPVLRRTVESAQRDVILVSPYFVPSDRSVELLCSLTRRGVRVRVLTNSLASTDVPVVHAGYARRRPGLLACGVELYELRPSADRLPRTRPGLSSGASLHAKAIGVDRKSVFLGSMNLDPRSKRLNTEVALQVESAEFGQELGSMFDEATAPDRVFRVGLAEPRNPASALHWESLEDGRPVRYTGEPLASLWRRIVTPMIGALTPENLL